MRVYIAADHAGRELADALLAALVGDGHEVEKLSPASLDKEDDYPDAIRPLALRVAGEPSAFGIALGASGQGEAMVANRVSGVRAAVYYGESSALHPKSTSNAQSGERAQTDAEGRALGIIESSRIHNNANILSLGARFISHDEALGAVRRFLSTPFSGEARHARRIAKF